MEGRLGVEIGRRETASIGTGDDGSVKKRARGREVENGRREKDRESRKEEEWRSHTKEDTGWK